MAQCPACGLQFASLILAHSSFLVRGITLFINPCKSIWPNSYLAWEDSLIPFMNIGTLQLDKYNYLDKYTCTLM